MLFLSSSYKLEPVQVSLHYTFLRSNPTLFPESSGVEVALTGRACPVMLAFKPEGIINFGTCNTGSSSTIDLQVRIMKLGLLNDLYCTVICYSLSARC